MICRFEAHAALHVLLPAPYIAAMIDITSACSICLTLFKCRYILPGRARMRGMPYYRGDAAPKMFFADAR